MGEPMKMDNLKSGHIYKISARNADVGIWISEVKGFLIPRTKFSDNFLFVEDHWDTGEPHGTVKPHADLGRAPFDYIDLLQIAKGIQNKEYRKVLDFLNERENKCSK